MNARQRRDVLGLLGTGQYTVAAACAKARTSVSAFYGELADNEDFSLAYARVRESIADMHAEEIIPIADGLRPIRGPRVEEDGTITPNAVELDNGVESRRVRIAARQWIAERWYGRQYAPKQKIEADVCGQISLLDVLTRANIKAKDTAHGEG